MNKKTSPSSLKVPCFINTWHDLEQFGVIVIDPAPSHLDTIPFQTLPLRIGQQADHLVKGYLGLGLMLQPLGEIVMPVAGRPSLAVHLLLRGAGYRYAIQNLDGEVMGTDNPADVEQMDELDIAYEERLTPNLPRIVNWGLFKEALNAVHNRVFCEMPCLTGLSLRTIVLEAIKGYGEDPRPVEAQPTGFWMALEEELRLNPPELKG
ncbi:hypothetical protein F6X40_24140 [Paraburkholderia sp. UCT31]|uniref:hypothetical protein n=1 Tax=Paraburkholderia sp. UCT31 TaxID=2615209 RepID=UPI001655E8F7|nr:hypothetical protein [Paraburkholderia sp. UCT31]MBC8739808.1 hypothetical protein [Paraburkholderia sp. UCT31]